MDDDQRREEIVELVHRWAEYYNDRVEEFAHATYSPDCRVDVKNGIKFRGLENFAKIEIAVAEEAPGRRMTVERVFVDGDTAVVLASTEFPHRGEAAPKNEVCAVLTFDGDKVATDETFMDLRRWPTPKFTKAEWDEMLD